MAAHQAPLSLGFSRQEYWSGLPFPSPMHACMLSHFSCVQLCVTPWTTAHQVPWSKGFSRQEYWSGLPFPSPLGRNTGVDNQSLLQGISPTQGLNPCLLHCRWILYRLNHQGSPLVNEKTSVGQWELEGLVKSLADPVFCKHSLSSMQPISFV